MYCTYIMYRYAIGRPAAGDATSGATDSGAGGQACVATADHKYAMLLPSLPLRALYLVLVAAFCLPE